MPWIENVSLANIKSGHHYEPGENAMLIQIVDPAMAFPDPLHKFKEVHQFEFLDIEDNGMTNNGDGSWSDMSEFAITDEQADRIVSLLRHALDNYMNVIVHCVAGICRSGAVVEVGIILGFDDTGNFRNPNLLVKRKLLSKLGWTYTGT